MSRWLILISDAFSAESVFGIANRTVLCYRLYVKTFLMHPVRCIRISERVFRVYLSFDVSTLGRMLNNYFVEIIIL